ncbi:hypothetical protein TD95_001860 [Thielaviopsis punctulata]|uniref:Peroxin-3 n=1 Tax=Thielaviopsis punctulata TaxID=72032 RepID=A0A0F4ZCM1_9PEZI|nr:hypothetical protein TD95_001860 [Thielaviopsis punctulata]
MLEATRRWFQRNRTPVAVGVGVLGAGYVAAQYVVGKINDARERLSSERVAKENLRRRFEQNQEDCTFTVMALLPTATQNILEAMNTESITYQIQRVKGVSRAGSVATLSTAGPPSLADTALTEDDGKSMNSESGVHASQTTLPPQDQSIPPAESADKGKPNAESASTNKAETPAEPNHASGEAAGGDKLQIPQIQEPEAQDSGQAAAQAAAEARARSAAAKAARKTKRQLWADLTISSITRAFTLVYTLALLTLLTRIQLNLLGRRSYLSSVVALATPNFSSGISLENNDDIDSSAVYGSDFDTNRKYLTFSWWLLNRGWVVVMQRVEIAVRQAFGPLSPRDMLSFDQLAERVLSVRKMVEGATPDERRKAQWLPTLLPRRENEDEVIRESGIMNGANQDPSASLVGDFSSPTSPASLRRLLDETADIIESPSFSHVLTLLLDSGFGALIEKKVALGAYDLPTPDQMRPDSPEMREIRSSRVVLLPKILSILTREARVIGNSMPNEYHQAMEEIPELQAFAAVVYSSNWEAEIQTADDLPPSVSFSAPVNNPQSPLAIMPRSPASRSLSVVRDEEDESVVMAEPEQSIVIVDPAFENVWEKVRSGGQ